MSWPLNPDLELVQTLAVIIGILGVLAAVGIAYLIVTMRAARRHKAVQRPRPPTWHIREYSSPPRHGDPEPRPPRWVNNGTPHCPHGWCDGAITDDPLTDWDRDVDPKVADW